MAGQQVHRRYAHHIMIFMDLYMYFGSLLANDSKGLEKEMPFRTHTGIPSGLTATWVTDKGPNYGECYGRHIAFLP